MNEESSITPAAVSDGSDTDVVSLLKTMQQQLLFLERKIDLLISQSRERQQHGQKASPDRPFRKRSFSKPFHSFDRPQRHGRGEHGNSPREGDSAIGHFYEHRPRGKSRGPNPKKKSVFFKRKDQE